MTKDVNANHAMGIMSRLAKNQEGNIIAMMAAAVIPAIGLVGGAVDMSRLYLTQARLQGACDAGALIGRKTMGVGNRDGNARAKAFSMFDHNFQSGAYGTTDIQRDFTETGGNVTGTASTTVPMALMQVLGIKSRLVSVSCQAELRIPNTDVMFVLDTTASMNDKIPTIDAASTNLSKIAGLRLAVNCFYEALAKQNIDDVDPAECGETTDPTERNTGAVQLRFGFVPYAVNVNVGKLLPDEYMVDQWTYQSRAPKLASSSTDTISFGTESARTALPGSVTTSLADTKWTNTGADVISGGIRYTWWFRMGEAACAQKTPPPPDNVPVITTTLFSQTNEGDTRTRIYKTVTVTGKNTYQYRASGNQNNPLEAASCTLQVKTTNVSSVTTQEATTTPIMSSQGSTFTGWTYKPVTFDVNGLKEPGGAWNGTVSLPLGIKGVPKAIRWYGCIEERKTVPTTDLTPGSWDPVPANAFDMNIDLVPGTDNATKWAPLLNEAIYHRFTTTTVNNIVKFTEERTLNEEFIPADDDISRDPAGNKCPSEAKTLQTWSPVDFASYVKALDVGGSTYHDIGLLWGARIMSKTGIFAQINDTPDKTIEQHLVFMTDGATDTSHIEYTPYGVAWYDRRQTSKSTPPTDDQLDKLVNARTAALCTAIKKKNINLWVVSYGSLGDATETMLETCAARRKFFRADNVADLIKNFKKIAAEISALRITH